LEAVRLAASLGLRRGLRIAAAAAAAAESASANATTTSLEGRLLPAYLNAVPSSSSPSSTSSSPPPLLLRLMEQRFALGGSDDDSGKCGSSDATTTTTATTITVITPEDVDAIFDALQARGAVDGDPYWARVWPSALALAECLLARPELVRGKRVADVGAGLGVAGLAAALAGAREVALLDREPLALECARLSAEATALGAAEAAAAAAAPGPGGGGGSGAGPPPFAVERPERAGVRNGSGQNDHEPAAAVVDATGLRALTSVREVLGYPVGGDDVDGPGAPAAAARATKTPPATTTTTPAVVRAVPFDWHERPLPASLRGRFDVVLACDVLYEQAAVGPLAEVVPLLLSAEGAGRVLLADPPARTAANRERFLELLAISKAGAASRFAVDEASLRQCSPRQLDREMLGGQAGDAPVPVQVLHLRAVDGNDTVGLRKAGGRA